MSNNSNRDRAVAILQHYFWLLADPCDIARDDVIDRELAALVDNIIAAAANVVQARLRLGDQERP